MADIGNEQSSKNEYNHIDVGIPNQFNDTLVSLMEETGYSMVQENGQRKFGGPPPDWEGPAPLKGSEVFVGKIPRDCFEDELVPIFSKIGKIYEMRLMMDFSGSNRGYAFVMYTNMDDAKKAIQQLNNYQIRQGKYIGVVKSVDNCRLFVGGIPKTKTREEIREEMSRVTEGVVDVILYNSPRDKTKNRGFAFIEYESHRGAAIARRKLIPGRIQLFSQLIMVDWAEPEPEVDEEIMARVKVLYVRNLMEVTSEDTIREKFDERNPGSVEKVKKLRDFAFVHFSNREDAKMALNELNGTDLDGSIIEVTWAKPPDRSGRNFNREQRGNSGASYHNSYSNGPFGIESSQQLNYNTVPSQAVVSYPMGGRGSYGFRSPIRGRGRGAAGLRGGRGFYPGGTARHAEYRIYDFPPALIVPTNQVPMRQHKMPTQILSDFCQKHNLGEPVYQLNSSVQQGHNNSPEHLFNYKVVIPMEGTHQPREYHRSNEEAKQAAAHYTLMALGVNWDDISGPSSPDTPPYPPPSTPLSAFSSNDSPSYSPVCFAKAISPPLNNHINCAFNAVIGPPGRFNKSCDMTPAYYGIPANAYSISAATAAHY